MNAKFYKRNIWNGFTTSILLLVSILFGYFFYNKVDVTDLELLFGVLALLPFAAAGTLLKLRLDANSISTSEYLSANEAHRFSDTAEKKQKIFFFVTICNILAGIVSIVFVVINKASSIFTISFGFGLIFSLGTIALCIIEEIYYIDFKQHLKRRKIQRDKKDKLLDSLSSANGNATFG